MEKEIADREYQLKQKKKSAAKAKACASAPAARSQADDMIEVDDDIWSVPSEDEVQKGEKAGKACKTDTGKDAATAARRALREARELANSWKKEVAKAAKNMGSLNSVCQSLNSTITRCQKNEGLFSDAQLKSLQHAFGKCTKFRQRS